MSNNANNTNIHFSSVQSLICVQLFNSLQPHGLQHARLPCPSPSPGAYSNSCPLSWWCHPTISSSVVPFSSCPQSFSASGSFPVSQLFRSGGQGLAYIHFSHCLFSTNHACQALCLKLFIHDRSFWQPSYYAHFMDEHNHNLGSESLTCARTQS